MDYIYHIPPYLYQPIYIYSVMILVVITYFRFAPSNGTQILKHTPSISFPALVLALALILLMGLRPGTKEFGDTSMYIHNYENIINAYEWDEEWLWTNIAFFCKSIKLPTTAYLLLIDIIYIGTAFACCCILMKRNVWIAFLFVASSFSFYSYGINGIRNGTSLHILLLAIALITQTRASKIIGALLCIAAIGIHKSSMLPIASLLCALYVVKNPQKAINFWVASIFISLIAGNSVGEFFASLGFDDRMGDYFNGQENAITMRQFSHTGFRFDFLLYSAMPVLMTWYVTIKRKFNDRTFNIIAITYILANSFWVMVIRAAFSNRFAYLSWFLYPIVIAYPLLRFKIWNNQDKKTAIILLLYAGFTFLMYIKG